MAQHPSQWRQDPGGPPWSDDDQKPQDNPRPYSPVAETLFRKDLISAMKLPDNEPLDTDDYWVVQDTWKQEWERGVQVPVKPDGLPEPHVSALVPSCKSERFALPRKLICMNTAGSYKPETHQVTPMVLRAEQVCTYDLDNVDKNWLEALNGERSLSGLNTVTESEMEKTVEEFEKQCREKINSTLRNTDDLDIAQDDSIICDVCRSPDSEESNEMVFCDKCNICVHQACYGITTIPSGSWLCRTCTLGIKPPCELCPNKGGAMKSTRTGTKWAHVSCALWIPEVSIGDVEKMEPITKISSIPPSRWSLVCVLCKEKMGACIQCSVKTCKTAYHVTCAFKHNLEMRAIIEDENAEDGVKLRSYCQKHSLNSKKKAAEDSDSESGLGRKNMTPEEKSQARRQKMAKIEREFYKLVDLTLAERKIGINGDVVEIISKFWMLKRKAGGNKPLIPPRGEDESLTSLRGEDTERDKMKQLVNIRQDLERVRNLAYMVSRREKLSRSFVKLREQILEKQLALIADEDPHSQMSLMEMSAVLEANHGPTVYDKMFSNPESEQHSHEDFEMVVCRIAGEISDGRTQIRKDNPFRKKSTETAGGSRPAPYERIFSDTNESESDDSFINLSRHKKRESGSASKKSKPVTRSDSSMSSGEEENALKNLSPSKNKKNIYSDSESEVEQQRRGPGRPRGSKKQKEVKKLKKTESTSDMRFDSEDTQNSLDIKPKEVRTKAAMKAFNLEDIALAKKIMEDKARRSSESLLNFKSKNRQKEESDNDSFMDVDLNPSLLFVSQRSAARKAEQKISKKTKDSKNDPKQNKKGSKTADLFGTSDEDSSLSQLVADTKQRHRLDEIDPLLRKSPRRSSEHKKKHTSTDSESDSDDALRSSVNKVTKLLTPSKREKLLSDKHLSKSPKKSSKISPLENKKKHRDSSDDDLFSRKRRDERHHNDFDDLFDKLSGSDSDGGKKKLFDDFEHPEVYSDFVPQRKAAKKASAQLSEQNVWRKTQQEVYMAELAKQTEAVSGSSSAVTDKKKGKKEKKESHRAAGSESDVTRRRTTRSSSTSSSSSSSSSSDSDTDLRKSPRGRGRSPKGLSKITKPSKDVIRNQTKKIGQKVRKPRSKKSPRGDGEGKISSSKALEYLMQRESQVTNILTELRGPEPEPEATTPHQPSLDKKLKTSEGRAEGVQSPPPSPKDSSDSGSDSSSADSIILGIKARQKAEAERPAMFSDSDSNSASNPPLSSLGLGLGPQEDCGGLGGRPRDCDDQSVEQLQSQAGTNHHPASATGDGLKYPGPPAPASSGRSPAQKKSIFSPDRSPRPAADKSRGGEGSLLGREHDSSWKSPREWKFSESSSTGREVSAPPGPTTKSPALTRSYEGSRSSPMQQHRSPGFGRSPARHSQHPLNKSLDLNKSSDNLSKSELKKTEDSTVTSERDSSRKFSVESKDSDVDSAKSSLPDASMNGLPDFSKEDSTDTLFFGDKHGDNKQKTEQAPTKKDEGYVSAEKDQNDNAQEAVGKQREGLGVVTNDKVSPHKNFKRLSTEDPNNGSQEQALSKQSLWPDIFGQSGGTESVQQQLLEGQQRSRQHQKHDITNSLDNLAKDDNKNVADAFATQQQHLEALLMNQMFNHQRKSGHESLSQQSTLAYMQQYMKELGGYNTQALQASQAYQQQILLQQMQQQAAFGLKSQDPDYQMYQAMYQAQEAWYRQSLQEEQKRQHDEKMIQEERRKQEERRLQDEKKKLDDKRRKEEMFRQEEMKRQEEQKKKQEEKRREEEERKKKEEDHKLLLERLKKEEETRQMEKQKRVEEQRRLEDHRLQQESQRLEYQKYQNMHSQGYGPEFLRQQQEYFASPFAASDKHLGTVGQVEAQLGAWFGKEPGQAKKGPTSPSGRGRPGSPKSDKKEGKAGPGMYNVPSATPADQLPGFVPSREHKRQSHESHKDRDTPQSAAGSDNSAPSGIPNELLDSVLETAKLPVWKPPDKGEQAAFSPAKVSQSPSKPPPVPPTERDNTFDDLVRHIDCSPSQKPDTDNEKLRPNKYNLLTDQASASEAERSDYDNDGLSMGGVDYDDPEDDYPKSGKLPQKKVAAKAPDTVTRRGTKVPCYAEKTEEDLEAAKLRAVPVVAKLNKAQRGRPGRVFGGRKGLKIDQKAIEKVHKNLAGTDFDFENEFDDDFGASPKQELKSLKGFREQTKKAPIYMKESEADQDQIPPVPFEEEEFAMEEKVPEKLTSFKSKGRPRKVVDSDPSDTVDAGDSKEFPKFKISLKNKLPKKSEDEVEELLEKVEKPKPKIPTLKIKFGRNDSPASIDEEEPDMKASKKRRSSLERQQSGEDQQQRIPKLKIKFGGIKEQDSGRDEADRGDFEEPPPLVIRSGTTPTSSPRNKQRTPTHNSKPGTPASEKLSTSELALESLRSDIAKSSPRSASLASTSYPAGRGSLGDSSSDLQKIFGTGEPLPVSVINDNGQPEAGAEKSEDGPSELELLALELSNQLAKDKQRKAAEEASKKESGNSVHHHDPKYKFKQLKQSQSEGEAPHPPTPVKNNLSQASAASAADSNPLRRMRKKELLNQYYGIELPPQAPPVSMPASNGPLMEPPPPPAPTNHTSSSTSLERNRMVIGIKMPKAVASVTSVPTRADYQQQLEANLERKRKREGKEDYKKGKGSKSGKGGKKNVWEEPYKPKIKMNQEDAEAEGDNSKEVRRTRGKPPKKCLAVDDSPERDPVESFIENKKNESLRYAEEVLATFDKDEDKSERRRKDKKKRRRDAEDGGSQPNSKTPRIVIKFSKNKEQPASSKNIPPDNGLIKTPAPAKDSSSSSEGPSLKLPKLKIKNLIEPSTT